MKLADKIIEASHQNTKVRGVSEGFGSRKARLTIKESVNMMKKLLDQNAGPPHPKTKEDQMAIKEAMQHADVAMQKLYSVKESRKC